MRKVLFILFIPLLLQGCKKSTENILWEKSFGTGRALIVRNVGDTGFVSCGEMDGKQYLIFTDKSGNKKFEYKSDQPGLLTSVIPLQGYLIIAGSTGEKLTLGAIDFSGIPVWDTVVNSSFPVEYSVIRPNGGENFLAVGSADPDSAVRPNSGLSFLWFDASGNISQKQDLLYLSDYVAARDIVTDNGGNIYLAFSRAGASGQMKAEVTRFSSTLQEIWNKEIYNNPSYGAASLGIVLDDQNNPVVSGRTEMQVSTGKENNAFVARYFFKGDSIQKCYLEYANSGASVINDGAGQFMVLNKNCLIVNIMDQNMKVKGIIRTFSSCDAKSTDAFGYSLDITGDGNIIMAGSKGNSFYMALKSSSALSPV